MPATFLTSQIRYDYFNVINSGDAKSVLLTIVTTNAAGVETGRFNCNGDASISANATTMNVTITRQVGTSCGASWLSYTFTKSDASGDIMSGAIQNRTIVLKKKLSI